MGAITNNVESSSTVPAGRLYKALLLDMDNLIPKILPQVIERVVVAERDSGSGTIKEFFFGQAAPIKCIKQRVDAINKDALTFNHLQFHGCSMEQVDLIFKAVESYLQANPDAY